jgi:hypothetical protein
VPDLSTHDVKELQRALNAFTDEHLKGIAPLIVDGDKGAATDKRIRTVKWYLGFKAPTGAGVTRKLIPQLQHPKRASLFPSKEYVERGEKRRDEQREEWRRLQRAAEDADGVTTFDGVPVAVIGVPHLKFARAHGWLGRLVSGWRDPAYSEQLCYRMCGAPSCPGRCAGRSSNHAGKTASQFAEDVSDYVRFGQLMARPDAPNPRIFNALGAQDPVHFSPTGR